MMISDKKNRYVWCAAGLTNLEQDLERFARDGFSVPAEPGGWWHQYVCPTHHTELVFDECEDDARQFRCPYGCTLEGEPYRSAWLVFKHQSLARYALQSAAVYAGTRDPKHAELGKSILVRYAKLFPNYPVHPDAQPWMLKGRAFHQALTEAIWACTLIRAYLLLVDEGVDFSGEAGYLDNFFRMLEESMTQYRHILIFDKKNPENNYTAWLNAALSAVYAAQNDKPKLLGLIDGEGGFVHHLSIGVHPDQFEFEGSTYYHIFVLRAYLIAAEMAERFGIDLYRKQGERGQSVEGMLDVLADLSNGSGELPALHDGPYQRAPYAREIAEIFEIALRRFGKTAYVPILAEAYRQLYGAAERQGLEAVVFGDGDWEMERLVTQEKSVLLSETGFAVGRHSGNPLSFLIDFGPHGGSHGHYDKLHLSVTHALGAVTPDFGTVPYSSAMRHGWYAATCSHNTVAVGGRSQEPHTGRCAKFDCSPQSTYIWTVSDQAYAKCRLSRHVLVNEFWLLDWYQVHCAEPANIDWFMHHLGTEAQLRDNQWQSVRRQLGMENGYNMIAPTHRWAGDGSQCDLLLPVGGSGSLARVSFSMATDGGAELYQFASPGPANDPAVRTFGLLNRRYGTHAEFIAVYRDGAEPASVRKLADSDAGRAVEIRCGGQSWVVALTAESGLVMRA